MKRLFLTWVFILSIMSVTAADIGSISNAFKGGNASSLSESMDKEVDIVLPYSSKKCPVNDAISLLNAFFENHQPTDFKIVHHADKKENGFFVGKLPTSSGEFRVNVTYRSNSGKAIIQSIRIE